VLQRTETRGSGYDSSIAKLERLWAHRELERCGKRQATDELISQSEVHPFRLLLILTKEASHLWPFGDWTEDPAVKDPGLER